MGFRKGRSFHEAARRPARRVKASVRSDGAPQRPARGRETTPDKLLRPRKRPSERGGNHPRGRFPPLLRNQRRISPTATGPPSGRCPPDNGLVAPLLQTHTRHPRLTPPAHAPSGESIFYGPSLQRRNHNRLRNPVPSPRFAKNIRTAEYAARQAEEKQRQKKSTIVRLVRIFLYIAIGKQSTPPLQFLKKSL